MNRRGLLAIVHCARKDLALSEDTYRAALENLTGKSSARDLSDSELARVADHFRALGWKPKNGTKRSDKPHVRKVWALWRDLCKRDGVVRNPSDAALRAFIEKRTGVTDPEWLTPAQASMVIESLKQWTRRAS